MADSPALKKVFTDKGVEATLVIQELGGSSKFVHNESRAEKRFTIASTFKILHSLIALNEGITDGQREDFVWDGKKRWLESWNQNHSLKSAYAASCVWCYQDIAKKIAPATYQYYLQLAGFSLPAGFTQTEFWLNGELQVSAVEQVEFLRRLLKRELPTSKESYSVLKSIMLHEDNPEFKLYAKTGWGVRPEPGVGWFVGYLLIGEDTWLFALNMEMRSQDDLPLRKELALNSLRTLNLIK